MTGPQRRSESDGFELGAFARQLVEQAADAIVYADAAGTIVYWNGGAERIFGFSRDDAVGRPLDIIIPENLRARHGAGFAETIRTGKTRYGGGDLLSVPALRRDGSRISVEFTIVPFHGDDGRMIGIAAVMRDVTAKFEEMKALRKRAAGAATTR